MTTILEELFECIVLGRIDRTANYPAQMKGRAGADEYTVEALKEGVSPTDIMDKILIPAMGIVGQKFTENKIFVPQMLLSAKAMNASMVHLKPFFQSGEVKRKGTFILGTVFGDLHDIGKNIVGMMIEGAGWEVINLGINVKTEEFLEALRQYPDAVVGMSALLTTTMVNMEPIIKAIKEISPNTKVLVGGAPVSPEFAVSIGADGYGKDPQESIRFLNSLAV